MDTQVIITDIIIPIFCALLVPLGYFIFRDIRKLELEVTEMKGESKVLDEKVIHIENNYKVGIQHLDEKISSFENDITEMKTDIKELIRMTHNKRHDD